MLKKKKRNISNVDLFSVLKWKSKNVIFKVSPFRRKPVQIVKANIF